MSLSSVAKKIAPPAKAQPGDGLRRIARLDGSRPRVLYAEDQPTSRIVTTALLERLGLDVHAVEDGELALAAAETSAFDLILLDIEMPIMDGVSAARGIRALGGAHARTPILALSAFLADSTEQSHWRGAFDFALPKPANGDELDRAIREALTAHIPEPEAELTPFVMDDLAKALRAQLPKPLWLRLSQVAAEEAAHYVNAARTAAAACDMGGMSRCLEGLKSLGVSFGHVALVETISATSPHNYKAHLPMIASHVERWPA